MRREIDYWDGRAGRTQGPIFYDEIALYKREEHLALISKWMPADARSVLKTDLFQEAFGEDRLLDALNGTHSRVVGMDLSRTVVERARDRVPGMKGLVSDVGALAFKDGAFGVVISDSTLDHLQDGHVRRAVDELYLVLAPGGRLILTLDNGHNALHRVSNRLTKWIGGFYAERCWTVEEISRVLRERGFEVTQATAIFHVPPGLNWAAKKAGGVTAMRGLVRFVIGKCRGLGAWRTRFITGRYIAVMAVRAAT